MNLLQYGIYTTYIAPSNEISVVGFILVILFVILFFLVWFTF